MVYIRSITYKTRLIYGVILIFVGNVVPAVYMFYDDVFEGTPEDSFMNKVHTVSFLVGTFGTSMIDAAITGYLKAFHPDLSEPWGFGISLAQFFNIPANWYTSNY